MDQPIAKRATREEILKVSVSLFARQGYNGVAMREIAASVGVQAPALYYHFPDKQSLYLAVMEYAFTNSLSHLTATMQSDALPFTRLQQFVTNMVDDLTGNPDLLLLLQRERLDGDETRQKLLVKEVFEKPFLALMGMMRELAPERDAFLLALSINGIVMHHLENRLTLHLLPGWRPEHDRPDLFVEHVCGLLKAMLGGEGAKKSEGRHECATGG